MLEYLECLTSDVVNWCLILQDQPKAVPSCTLSEAYAPRPLSSGRYSLVAMTPSRRQVLEEVHDLFFHSFVSVNGCSLGVTV